MMKQESTRRIFTSVTDSTFKALIKRAEKENIVDEITGRVDLATVFEALVKGYATGSLSISVPKEPTVVLSAEEEDAKWNR